MVRSAAHLAFVRTRPCAWCASTPTEASHHGQHGTSTKPSDFRAIPLCRTCHGHWHQKGTLPGTHMDREQLRSWFVEQALLVCSARLAP